MSPSTTPAATGMADGAGRLASLIRAEQLRLYEANLRLALPAYLVLALLVTAVLWREAGPVPLTWWWVAFGLALVLRNWERLGRWAGQPAHDGERLRRTRFGSWALALVWGLTVLLLPPGELLPLLFLVVVLVGLTAGAITMVSFDPFNSLLYGLLAFAPMTVFMWVHSEPYALSYTGMLALHLAVGGAMALRAWEMFKASVALRAREAERMAALAHSEEQLRRLTADLQKEGEVLHLTLDSIDQGLMMVGPDGRVSVFNRRACELTGVPDAVMAARPAAVDLLKYQVAHGVLNPDWDGFAPARRAHMQRVLRGEASWPPTETYVRRGADGRLVEVKTRRLHDGSAVRTYSDVTASAEAQAKLQASEAEARKLALVAAHTDNGVVILDARRRIEWVNASFSRHSGWTLDQLRGRGLDELMRDAAADEADLAAMADELGQRGHTARELQFTNALGRRLWVALELRCIRDDGGEVQRYIIVARDVEARRKTDAALRAARDEALRASRAKTEFLSAMSHELRTPLNAILGFSHLLENDPSAVLDERRRRQVREIRAAGDHLLALISDVLDLARVEAGALALSAEPVAVREVLDECLQLLRPLAERQQVHLPAAAPPDALAVRADRRRLKQVLLNLLSNAVKFNGAGGRVTLALRSVDTHLRIEVVDDGPGIAPSDQARLFSAFERLDAERRGVEGVGVGLALSRRLVELMGGAIGVDSVPGEGSTFWLTLPMAAVAPPMVLPPAPLPCLPRGPRQGLWLLLYIEDNPVNTVLMEAMLAHDPAVALRSALLPEEGLALARTEPPDLVLLDIQLPGMDGFEVQRRLRQDPLTAAIPVLAISASAMPGDIERARQAGFADYLAKPVDQRLLVHTLCRLLPVAAVAPGPSP